jgi:cob(I)alamin adenosyltransferase
MDTSNWRQGDRGITGLIGGERVSKNALRVYALGEVDELNAFLGLAVSFLPETAEELRPTLENIQQIIFDIGEEIGRLSGKSEGGKNLVKEEDTAELQILCDDFKSRTPPLSDFVLPGGSQASATLNVARAVTRRAERTAVALLEEYREELNPEIVRYLNRLSITLFYIARFVLHQEKKPELLRKKRNER